jgi:hypothetical protein
MRAVWVAFRIWMNAAWILGRRSETAYVRVYPNPGLMFPWFGGRRVVYSRSRGWFVRPRRKK